MKNTTLSFCTANMSAGVSSSQWEVLVFIPAMFSLLDLDAGYWWPSVEAHQSFVLCQRFDLCSLLFGRTLLPFCAKGLWLTLELHKGRLCLVFLLDCICYFLATSWSSILQASVSVVSNGCSSTCQQGWHAVLF